MDIKGAKEILVKLDGRAASEVEAEIFCLGWNRAALYYSGATEMEGE